MENVGNYWILLFFFVAILSSCQYRTSQKELNELAEKLSTLESDSSKLAKQKAAEIETAKLDSIRGYSLPETQPKKFTLSYNGGVALVIIIGVLFFGLLIFRFVKGIKKGMKDYSYAQGEMREKAQEIMNSDKYNDMSPEEKEQFDKMMNFLNKKGKDN